MWMTHPTLPGAKVPVAASTFTLVWAPIGWTETTEPTGLAGTLDDSYLVTRGELQTALAGVSSGGGGGSNSTVAGYVTASGPTKTALDGAYGAKAAVDANTTALAALPATYQQARTAGRRAVATRPAEQGFTLERVGHTGQPFLTINTQNVVPGKTPSTTFYWPFLIHARSTIGATALDEWYLLHSTDHDDGNGGIWLSTAPSWKGPWTGRGLVYVDTASGNQTETPTAVWLPDEKLFAVLYQNANVSGANGKQTTCVATSPTLLAQSFTRVGRAIDIQAQGAMPGDGHTGYASVHADGGVFYAHHLMGGGNPSLAGISQSVDMRTWWTDPRPLLWAFDQIDGTLRLPWGGIQVVRWRGVLWMLGTLTNGAAGTDPRISKIFSARLAEDRRHIIGRPTFHLTPTGSETSNYRSLNATVTPDGELVVIYQCDDAFYLAQAA